jgi:L-fuconolactonase
MQIDSHRHFWRYDAVRDSWIANRMRVLQRDFPLEHPAPELSANGIDATVAVQIDQSEDETTFPLGFCNENRADRDPCIAGVAGWVDLRARNLPERREYFSQLEELRGFRHIVQGEPDDRFPLRDEFCRGISRLREGARQLPAAVEFVERFPDQPFVVDHIAKPAIAAGEIAAGEIAADQIAAGAIESRERNLRAIAVDPNVFCKLSGLIADADWNNWSTELLEPYLRIAFDAFGAARLMFGSDWPVCLLAASYDRVKELAADFAAARKRSRPKFLTRPPRVFTV